MAAGLAVGFGVLTVDTHAQALERLDIGRDAAIAALQTAKIIKSLEKISE
jgi:6,7-dimethyl-8-ribityllumazine synthase